ncbi:MAG: hypothetical protein JOZ17_25400 [Acetobacteraceae bacterium]|nr:hypothetical protein [Acetobacteraceae bacterium]
MFGESAFLAKLDAIAGFILADIVEFPLVSVFKIPTEFVKRWYANRELNAAAKISRIGFHARLAPQLPNE